MLSAALLGKGRPQKRRGAAAAAGGRDERMRGEEEEKTQLIPFGLRLPRLLAWVAWGTGEVS